MADFRMDSDITTYNSLEIALYRNGPLAKASSADIITERMSSDHNPENGYAEVGNIGLVLRLKLMSKSHIFNLDLCFALKSHTCA